MKNTTISIIAAIGKNRELGKNNHLLWKIKADMEHFKKITSGHPVIMGRKTFESIGHPLSNRKNIVVTSDKNYSPSFLVHPRAGGDPGSVIISSSLETAFDSGKRVDNTKEIFIIGGANIYTQGIKYADKLYLTVIDATRPDADTFFPDYSEFKKVISHEEKQEGKYHFTFIELAR